MFKNDQITVLLITNWSGKRWIIPKGMIEDDLTSCESAVREAYEEGGIKGKAYDRPIGQYQYKKWNGTCNVEVFLFEVYDVLADWPEAHFRRRTWLSVDEAAALVNEKALKDIIRQVPKLLDKIKSEQT
jgi:8-oxo-dGTP pyrophosphatase MutT (NUDIX family)